MVSVQTPIFQGYDANHVTNREVSKGKCGLRDLRREHDYASRYIMARVSNGPALSFVDDRLLPSPRDNDSSLHRRQKERGGSGCISWLVAYHALRQ